jgi:hypothetical protein
MHIQTLKRSIAAGAVIAAAGLPAAAQAQYVGVGEVSVPVSPPVAVSHPSVTASHISQAALGHRNAGLTGSSLAAPVAPSATQPRSSFDWGDAGIGAASMVVLMGLGAGATAMARSRQRHHVLGG